MSLIAELFENPFFTLIAKFSIFYIDSKVVFLRFCLFYHILSTKEKVQQDLHDCKTLSVVFLQFFLQIQPKSCRWVFFVVTCFCNKIGMRSTEKTWLQYNLIHCSLLSFKFFYKIASNYLRKKDVANPFEKVVKRVWINNKEYYLVVRKIAFVYILTIACTLTTQSIFVYVNMLRFMCVKACFIRQYTIWYIIKRFYLFFV